MRFGRCRRVTLDPDPATGLQGDTLLYEALADHLPDDGAATDPGVYVLELSTPTGGLESHARAWVQEYETVPDYLETLADKPRVWYVGAAASVRDRIDQHLTEPNQSASVCRVFPPHSIVDVRWADSADDAFTWEHGVALDLDAQHEEVYVHSR